MDGLLVTCHHFDVQSSRPLPNIHLHVFNRSFSDFLQTLFEWNCLATANGFIFISSFMTLCSLSFLSVTNCCMLICLFLIVTKFDVPTILRGFIHLQIISIYFRITITTPPSPHIRLLHHCQAVIATF